MSAASSLTKVMRLVALGIICAFSLIVLAINIYMMVITVEQAGFYFIFNACSAGISFLTLLVFPPLLIVGFIRSSAIVTSIIVEIIVLALFWILWLATAAYTSLFLLNCDSNSEYLYNNFIIICHQPQAIGAFSWLNWLILTAYWPFLLVMAIIQQNRGNPVWTKPIHHVNMFAPPVVYTTGVVQGAQPQQPVVYAAQPVHQPVHEHEHKPVHHPVHQHEHQPVHQPVQPQPQPPSTPGTTYVLVPATGGQLPPQPHHAPTLPLQQPQQHPHMGGGHAQV